MEKIEFFTGGELELMYGPPDVIAGEAMVQRRGVIIGDPRPEEVDAEPLIAAARDDARAMLDTLHPKNDYEAERLAGWKRQVPELTLTDAINFRVYESWASPRITTKESTVGMMRKRIERLHDGELEFRFGQGILQDGYYDNPNISEVRIAPGPAADYFSRRDRLLEHVCQTAARFGCAVLFATEHVNASAFDGEQPYFGNHPDEDIVPYRKAVAGIARLYEDGALYDKQLNPSMPADLLVGPWREQDIRVIPGRFELRVRSRSNPRCLSGLDVRRSLRYMLSGMQYGLRYATENDLQLAQIRNTLTTNPGPGYEHGERADLRVRRYLSGFEVTDQGDLNQIMDSHVGHAFNRLSGAKNDSLSLIPEVGEAFAAGLELAGHSVQLTPKGYADILKKSPDYHREVWQARGLDGINAMLARVAVTATRSVTYKGESSPRNGCPPFDIYAAAQSVGAVDPQKYAELREQLRW